MLHLGQNIKLIRGLAGFIQKDFAKLIGEKLSNLKTYETKGVMPKPHIQEVIAKIGGVTKDDLIGKKLTIDDITINVEVDKVKKVTSKIQGSFMADTKVDGDYTTNIVFNLSESSREHAIADRVREENYKRMIDLISIGSAFEEIPQAVETRFVDLLELIAELGTGTRWKSKKEGLAALSKLWLDKKRDVSKAGIRNG